LNLVTLELIENLGWDCNEVAGNDHGHERDKVYCYGRDTYESAESRHFVPHSPRL